jgi:hypothetical protein
MWSMKEQGIIYWRGYFIDSEGWRKGPGMICPKGTLCNGHGWKLSDGSRDTISPSNHASEKKGRHSEGRIKKGNWRIKFN